MRAQPMKCPLCQQALSVEMIRVDGYVDSILKVRVYCSTGRALDSLAVDRWFDHHLLQTVPRHVDHVLVDAEGEWSAPEIVQPMSVQQEHCQPMSVEPPAKHARTTSNVGSPPWTMLSPSTASPSRALYAKAGPFTPHTPVQLSNDALPTTVAGYASEYLPYTPHSVGSQGSQATTQHSAAGVGENLISGSYEHSGTCDPSGSSNASGGRGSDLDDVGDLLATSELEWRALLASTNLADAAAIDEMLAYCVVPHNRKTRRSIDAVESAELKQATQDILALFD